MLSNRVSALIKASLSFLCLLALSGCGGDGDGETTGLAGYYRDVDRSSPPALRRTLHDLIDDHEVIGYSQTDELFALTDRDPQQPSGVLLFYSRRPEPALCCEGEWNREHVWPNAMGIDRRLPPYSDLHNLRPADYDVNAERGHKFFDESDPDDQAYREPAHPESPLCSADSDSWEPPAEIKGDIARALFYMAIRYEGDGGEPDLELSDEPSEITTAGARMGRLSTLIGWHAGDPVSPEERLRNDRVHEHQGNRNPFVDHPEWVGIIWK